MPCQPATICTIWTATAQPYCRQHYPQSVIPRKLSRGTMLHHPHPIAILPLGRVVPRKSARWRDAVAMSDGLRECTRNVAPPPRSEQLWYRERPIASETGLFVSFWPSNTADGEPRLEMRNEPDGMEGYVGFRPFDVSCPMRQADAAKPGWALVAPPRTLSLSIKSNQFNQSIDQ